MHPLEPTADQCDTHASIEMGGGRAVATWLYPQMGGYASRCWIVPDGEDDGCFDVHIWHDGDFPFTGDATAVRQRGDPVVLHHCDPGQFATFAEFAARVCRGEDVTQPPPRRPEPGE